WGPSGVLDAVGEFGDLVEQVPVLAHLAVDLPDGVEHRGVVAAAELGADLRQGQVRQLAAQVHRDLAGRGDGGDAAGAGEVVHGDAEVARGHVHDRLRVHPDLSPVRHEVAQHVLGEGEVDLLLVQARQGGDPGECTLEL